MTICYDEEYYECCACGIDQYDPDGTVQHAYCVVYDPGVIAAGAHSQEGVRI